MRLGFEVEIEDITQYQTDIPGINITNDDSLRNGREFVSSILPDKEYASFLYGYLHKNLEGSYSERCGLHFHMDVTSKNKTSKLEFIKRYIQVERTLFRVHSDILRSNNNFCSLLLDSNQEIQIIRNYNKLGTEVSDYSKYSALNIKPMLTIGTFEFRALKAGVAPERFEEILNIFDQLWDFNATIPYEDQISDIDREEANSVIALINSTPQSDSGNDEYMNYHFIDENQTSDLFGNITEETIRAYLNSM